MKITLLDIRSARQECINKDFMGGYGWAFDSGIYLGNKLINWVKRHGERMPLMSFGYLAAILQKAGHRVEYAVNCIPDADYVLMSSSMVDHRYELEWAKKIKDNKVRVGFIGPFASYKPELFLESCDFVVKGEPEAAIYELAAGKALKGIVESPAIEDINSLPFPQWGFFPVNSYSYVPALKERPILPVLASRGCKFKCNYCPYVVSHTYRCRSPQNVLNELQYLKDKFKVRAVLFRDPLFGCQQGFIDTLCDLILSSNLKLKWACETRLDMLDQSRLKRMYKAGLRVLNTGIESSDVNILAKATRVAVSVNHQEQIIRFCDQLGIRVTAFYILGLPSDSIQSIQRTIKYAQRLNTHVAQFFVHTPFPGTEYYQQVRNRILEKDWERFDCYTPVIKHENLSFADIIRLKSKAFISYYFRLGYLLAFIRRMARDYLDWS